MGNFVQVFPGEDGLVRNVQVKMATGTYTRPITKICVIYPAGYTDENGISPVRGGGGGGGGGGGDCSGK